MKKEQSHTMSVATKTVAKLQPIVLDLQRLLLDDNNREKSALKQLPKDVVSSAMSLTTKVAGMLSECQNRMGDPTLVFSFDLAEVAEVALVKSQHRYCS